MGAIPTVGSLSNKTCPKCKQSKPLSDFSKNKRKLDGYNYECKACHKLYWHTNYTQNKSKWRSKVKERKQKLLAWYFELKCSKYCEDCGERHPACLDFHHTENKLFNIGHAISSGYSKEKILREISKCKVFCSNCHRKKHWYLDYQYAGMT